MATVERTHEGGSVASRLLTPVDQGWVPDRLIRSGIRTLLGRRLRAADRSHEPGHASFLAQMAAAPIAPIPAVANEQHYEVPADLFALMLGPYLKYSSGLWDEGAANLGESEEAMLALTCQRAEIANGMRILELGCGWGSLTMWMAERYPASQITAVSNSADQRHWIERECAERGLANISLVTADINEFRPEGQFDRVVSVEMFEHMRNWGALLTRIADWLAPEGRLFVHVFCHRRYAYLFEPRGAGDWMARHFFTAGMMPSLDLIGLVDSPLSVRERWEVNGTNYARTAEAWLAELDANADAARTILADHHARREAARWLQRWRIFYMACAELFAFADGEEWLVAHYLLARDG